MPSSTVSRLARGCTKGRCDEVKGMLPAPDAGDATLMIGETVTFELDVGEELGVDGETVCRRDGVAGGGLKKSKTS